ncbi:MULTISPECIES: 16S rRNA (uracil(1498)-N(3))-methyltransferase [unclassified Rathayibacter]|uniref:16S rRNA (uracil(1498)-N(3))-methyltransferase n=1 Tax=unclassified Rathayibacter TaxID=2609250 RepID=UPI000CE7CE0C|nr:MULTISPECIES: 16S rRNA (uracil(1498)-N(3))-methyltransferase [unclassified Rathayibacter]PPF12720.1 16S rRNA (uracil(1498)-N(3))-methyltransferase [Rathayibacter sp. AY1A4]PPF41742.1 16S rRNA (uracil(1498)-N(3))-methyltransferase [Rathayibacter sp. AY1A1]PPG25982.1 16S rRNA (uracil(1498)-N(3))-methyltransferase [Rathayibacter sp. AY2B9]PPG83549.1 16S rRNA (uracil(1498)-N(3))-methyltransferase [Rathayibacter sp. AY1E5]PPG84022.1 16S rRNA (uracil(1498)-N(3))-methyltransferase [Rathayibacter s
MAHHYIDESLDSGGFVVGGRLALTGAEARHAATVSRIRAGESVRVGDGRGLVATAVVESAEPARVVLVVESVQESPVPSPRLVLVQALAKGDRDELAVQAATELGVDEVVPWQAARSISRWSGPKEEKGRERWRAIVREASKQSLRPRVPEVAPLEQVRGLVARAATSRVLVLEPSAQARLSQVVPDGRDLVLVVGPEGGIAPEELRLLAEAGAEAVALGDSVLRTSTAGPAAIAVLSARLGRW